MHKTQVTVNSTYKLNIRVPIIVYRSHDLAVVRVTWYLRVSHNNQVSLTQDEGLDVFKRNKKGNWNIVNYLSYLSKEASDLTW